MRYKTYGRGWHNESHRHSLAAKGIKTSFSDKIIVSPEEYEIDIKRTASSIKNYNKWLQDNGNMSDADLALGLKQKFGSINTESYAKKLVSDFRKWQKISILMEISSNKGGKRAPLHPVEYHVHLDKALMKSPDISDEELQRGLIQSFSEVTPKYAEQLVDRHRESMRRSKGFAGKLTGVPIDKTKQGIPITLQNPEETVSKGRKYPVSPIDVKKKFGEIPKESVEGISEISFRDPCEVAGTKQKMAWAQYVRSKNRINIFSQPGAEADNPKNRVHMISYVVPHEAAHHTALKVLKEDQNPMIVEEAQADLIVKGKDPLNSANIKEAVKERKVMYGEKGTI